MTRRERIEAKLEKREEWADGRASKAATLRAMGDRFRGDHAFNTQPGHIPERARMIRRDEKAYEHRQMAAHHLGKADGLRRALDTNIFSDDGNALEALEERLKVREAKRDRIKRFNATARKGKPDYTILNEDERKSLLQTAQVQAWALGKGGGFPGYVLSNLSGRIKTDRDRMKAIKRTAERTAAAEAAGGVLIARSGDYMNVTFAEKPEREVIDKLKAAGFWYSGGSWGGKASALPEGIEEG